MASAGRSRKLLCVGCVAEACPYPRRHVSSFPFLMPTDARTWICLPMLVLQRRCGRVARRWACISPPRPTQVKGASRAGEKQEVIESTLTQRVHVLGKRELRGFTLAPAVHAPRFLHSISNGRSGWLPTPLVDLSFGTKVSCRRRSRVRLGNPRRHYTCWMTCPWHHRRPMHQEATAKSSRRPAPTAASSQHPDWWAALPPPIPSSRYLFCESGTVGATKPGGSGHAMTPTLTANTRVAVTIRALHAHPPLDREPVCFSQGKSLAEGLTSPFRHGPPPATSVYKEGW